MSDLLEYEFVSTLMNEFISDIQLKHGIIGRVIVVAEMVKRLIIDC